ncbi:MAG: hypothetical protein ACRDJW_20065 [Thermomicrobiales bacterium]
MSGAGWGITIVLGLLLSGTIISSVLIWQIFRTVQISIENGGAPARDRIWRALVGPYERMPPAVERRPQCNGRSSARGAVEGEQ